LIGSVWFWFFLSLEPKKPEKKTKPNRAKTKPNRKNQAKPKKAEPNRFEPVLF
jgi:hypothetical protein